MNNFIKRIFYLLISILNSPLLILFIFSRNKKIIKLDIKRWSNIAGHTSDSDIINLLLLLSSRSEFRNLYYYRIKKDNILLEILMNIFKLFYKELSTLFIYADNIGPGLFIQHGICTIISAKSIGENCWISQQVTIGFNNKLESPTIGNNVMITAGAKVIGGIIVGDNVTIGANAVVVKNIPDNCVVAGVPANIIRRNGLRVNEKL
jgi:serine O-acetyltransferase